MRITSTYDAYIRENTDKKFWLVNTNKLLKQYEGVDGLKTGFTTEAMSCITVTAKKKDLRLVAVAWVNPAASSAMRKSSRCWTMAFLSMHRDCCIRREQS